MLNVQYHAPDAELSSLISSFYRLDYEGDSFGEVERADRAQFRFHLVGSGSYQFVTGFISPSYPVMITGPTTGPVNASSDGTLTIFGWGMTHAGWAALMGKDAEARFDTAFDAQEIFGDRVMELRDRLNADTNFARQVNIGEQAAREIYRHADTAPFEFTQKVDNWLAGHIDPDVGILVAATGLSPRQLERMTNRYYGMPPKKLARKYRALRAAQALAHGDSLDDTGMALAFYDQSHLIRELKAFTGLTPSQLKSGDSQLTQATMDGRRSLTGKVSPLISES